MKIVVNLAKLILYQRINTYDCDRGEKPYGKSQEESVLCINCTCHSDFHWCIWQCGCLLDKSLKLTGVIKRGKSSNEFKPLCI